MDTNEIIALVAQYGYGALFFCLWLGIVGMPLPDEVIVMIGGAVTSLKLLKPVPAFAVTYLGVVSGLSIGYILGRVIGVQILDRLAKRKNMQRYLEKSQGIVERYGSFALCISYFIPVVRHVVPYLAGVGKMAFPRYAAFSYSTGFIWTMIFFSMGRDSGMNLDMFVQTVDSYGFYILVVTLSVAARILVLNNLDEVKELCRKKQF